MPNNVKEQRQKTVILYNENGYVTYRLVCCAYNSLHEESVY